jgi:hypothetical protein
MPREMLDQREFLFGVERRVLRAARPLLMNLQHGKPFYHGGNAQGEWRAKSIISFRSEVSQ